MPYVAGGCFVIRTRMELVEPRHILATPAPFGTERMRLRFGGSRRETLQPQNDAHRPRTSRVPPSDRRIDACLVCAIGWNWIERAQTGVRELIGQQLIRPELRMGPDRNI